MLNRFQNLLSFINKYSEKTMKRNENIIQLSRDHHFGLLCSWKIRQGIKKETEAKRIQKYVEYFWKSHLKEHFREEETILFPYIDDVLSERVKSEHRQIENLVYKISENSHHQCFLDFADLLENHIRFEERKWFPHLENNLSEKDLQDIGSALDKIHSDEKDDYQDEFWK